MQQVIIDNAVISHAANTGVVSHDTSPLVGIAVKDVNASFKISGNTVKDGKGRELTPPKRTAVVLIEDLIAEKDAWQENAYRTSNEQLYALLAKCYGFYLKMADSGKDAQRLRDGLAEYIKQKGYVFSASSHTLVKIVKCVFGADRRRVSAYGIVLRAALSENITEDSIPQFIKQRGGVEEIRLAKSPNAMTVTQKAEIAKQTLTANSLAKVQCKAFGEMLDAGDIGKSVVLIGTWRADGSVEVHALSKSAGAVGAALASQYTLVKARAAEHTQGSEQQQSQQEAVARVVDSISA